MTISCFSLVFFFQTLHIQAFLSFWLLDFSAFMMFKVTSPDTGGLLYITLTLPNL